MGYTTVAATVIAQGLSSQRFSTERTRDGTGLYHDNAATPIANRGALRDTNGDEHRCRPESGTAGQMAGVNESIRMRQGALGAMVGLRPVIWTAYRRRWYE